MLGEEGHSEICLLTLLLCCDDVSSPRRFVSCKPLPTFLMSAMESATPRLRIRCGSFSGVWELKRTGLGDWTLELWRLDFFDLPLQEGDATSEHLSMVLKNQWCVMGEMIIRVDSYIYFFFSRENWCCAPHRACRPLLPAKNETLPY